MYTSLWNEFHGAVGCLCLYNENNIRIASFSGFKVKNHFITDDRIIHFDEARRVRLHFVTGNGISETTRLEIPYSEFQSALIKSSSQEDYGFIIFNINQKESLKHLPDLNIPRKQETKVGQEIAVLGFQCDKNILSINPGIITSTFIDKKGKKYLQIDSALKIGMTGAPIIDFETGNVIGIIKDNCNDAPRVHQRINDIAKNNIDMLKEAKGNLTLNGIDPFQALIANQYQIKLLSKTLMELATSKEGYGLEIVELIEDFFRIHKATDIPKIDIRFNAN